MTTGRRLPPAVHRATARARAVLEAASVRDAAVVVAVSGGGDSMALLEIAGLLAGPLALRLHVAWVDHGTRDVAAERALVAGAASRWGVPLHEARVDAGRDDEDTLRRARLAALESMASSHGCRAVLLGHTADDQVETVLLRVLRGGGYGALSGMREVRGPFVRPLLSLRRVELRDLLRERDVAWADDPTNDSDRYARGRLRRRVIPAVEDAFGRGCLDHLLDQAPRWRADDDYLAAEAARAFAWVARRRDGSDEIDLESFATLHEAMRARVLRRWLDAASGHATTARQVAALLAWLDGDGPRDAGDRPGDGHGDDARPDAGSRPGGGIDLAGVRVERAGGRLLVRVAAGRRVAAPGQAC